MKKLLLYIFFTNLLFAKVFIPYKGFMKGNYHLGVGSHFWNDHLVFRNMQLRLNFDLVPGLKFYSIIRSNTDLMGIEEFEPKVDEGYLESSFFYKNSYGKLSTSLKLGQMRYLRFPEPDIISQFDQVPGTEDLRYEDAETAYMGSLFTVDFNSKYNFGYHFAGIDWAFGKKSGSDIIENYVYYKNNYDFIDFEARYGELQLRKTLGKDGSYQLGRGGMGYDIYLGLTKKDYKVGFLYEEIYDNELKFNDVRTGVLVRFGENPVTDFLGKIRFDYTRAPEGFGAHLTIVEGEMGYEKNPDLSKYELVGEVEALRVITYWQNGQGRNFYEHIVDHWGDTDQKLMIVPEVKSWHLTIESLVSPHTEFSTYEDLVAWEKDRQGPAELNQTVIYRYYRLKK